MIRVGQGYDAHDEQYNNIASRELLRKVHEMMAARGWSLVNLDSTIVAQAPRLAPYLQKMIAHIAADLDVPISSINIKAATTEKLGFIGREEGIAAHVVVLLVSDH